jgi:glycosyltransferase involved in cell wall biosynthesis
MSVSVVIRCRNEEAHIGRLLSGLVRQRRPANEIIIVDSGSTDATLSIAAAFPVRVLHIPPDRFSFGAACNLGCEVADTDYVVLVSAHCYPVYDTWIERLVSPLENDQAIACTYGRQYGPPDARFSERQLFATWFPETSTRRQTHPFCNNANAAIRRRIWEKLRYDEHLTGLEDLDWAKRAMQGGHCVAYVAEAPVVHVHDETFGQTLNRYRREAIAHREIYRDQRVRRVEALRLAIRNIGRDYLDARAVGELRRNLLEIPKFRVAQFYGTYQGFAQHGPVTDQLKRRFFYPEEASLSAQRRSPDYPIIGSAIDYEDPEAAAPR